MTDQKKINIVLAGQGNSGKSSIFNYLTGLHQHIGNWAGKTIEKLEGTLYYKGYTIDVLDLPGIYSLTTFSVEELISREYIVTQKPDFVIDIIDSTNLERNLIFTLQLLELECPVILALNMIDLAKKKGIEISCQKLQDIINVPVLPTIASRGMGLTDVIDEVIELKQEEKDFTHPSYGKEIEKCISELSDLLRDVNLPYPVRWIAIKLLEKDKEIIKSVREKKPEIIVKVKQLCEGLEEIHGHDSSIVISDERSHLAAQITRDIGKMAPHTRLSLNERLDIITTNKFTGYLVMILILGGMFMTVFSFGNWLSGWFDTIFKDWHSWWNNNIGITISAALGWSA